MASQIRWSPRAAFNLEEIRNYIARDSKYYANLFAKRILAIVKNIPQFPKSGRIVPEYGDENLREKIYQKSILRVLLEDGLAVLSKVV